MDKTGQSFKSEANKTAKSKLTTGRSEKNTTKRSDEVAKSSQNK